jgi:hypothetical protein
VKKLLIIAIISLTFGAAASAQRGAPLVANPSNGGGNQTEAFRKKPLYKPPMFNDVPTGFPNRLLMRPFAQQQYDYQRRVHFGFVLAVSALDYKVISVQNPTYSSTNPTLPYNSFIDVTSLSPALGVAALMDYRISHNLSLRLQIGPTFGTRTLNVYNADADSLRFGMQLESVLLEMPMLMKYKALRNGDVRPYMVAGLTPYCDVSAFKNFNVKRNIYVALNPLDVAATVGIGFDAYFDFFKFAVEVKYMLGFFNAASTRTPDEGGYEQYPNAIDKMHMRSFVFSLIFE